MFTVDNQRKTRSVPSREEAIQLAKEESKSKRGEVVVTDDNGALQLVYERGRLQRFAEDPRAARKMKH